MGRKRARDARGPRRSAEMDEGSTGGSKRVTVRLQGRVKARLWPVNKRQYPEPRCHLPLLAHGKGTRLCHTLFFCSVLRISSTPRTPSTLGCFLLS